MMVQGTSSNETDLYITVKEKSYVNTYMGTTFTRDDLGLEARGTLRNPTGYGEVRSWMDGGGLPPPSDSLGDIVRRRRRHKFKGEYKFVLFCSSRIHPHDDDDDVPR